MNNFNNTEVAIFTDLFSPDTTRQCKYRWCDLLFSWFLEEVVSTVTPKPWRCLDFLWHAPGVILKIPTLPWQFSSKLQSTKWMKQLNRVKRQIQFQRFLSNINAPGNNTWLFHAVRNIDFWFFSQLFQNTPLRGVSRSQGSVGIWSTTREPKQKFTSPYLHIKCHKGRRGKHYFPNSGLVFKIILEEVLTLAVTQHCCISVWNPDKKFQLGFPEQDLQQ